jgi:hypothetical protein
MVDYVQFVSGHINFIRKVKEVTDWDIPGKAVHYDLC